MRNVSFEVVNETQEPTERRILVFLRPRVIPDQAELFAWQRLSPPLKGGSQAFVFTGRLELSVAESRAGGSRSAIMAVAPGSLCLALSERGQGPYLSLAPDAAAAGAAVRVENRTKKPLVATWYCDRKPVLEQIGLELGAPASFELVDDLFVFQLAAPSVTGRYAPREVLSSPFVYTVPADTATVRVAWRKEADGFELAFHPPSAPAADSQPAAAENDGEPPLRSSGRAKPTAAGKTVKR